MHRNKIVNFLRIYEQVVCIDVGLMYCREECGKKIIRQDADAIGNSEISEWVLVRIF